MLWCPRGHLPVDRVLLRAGVAVAAIVTLGDAEGRAGRVRQAVNLRVIVADGSAADGVAAGVAVIPTGVGVRREKLERFSHFARRKNRRERKVRGALEVLQFELEGDGDFRFLEVLNRKASRLPLATRE